LSQTRPILVCLHKQKISVKIRASRSIRSLEINTDAYDATDAQLQAEFTVHNSYMQRKKRHTQTTSKSKSIMEIEADVAILQFHR
jgi:hypothetical protein